MNNILPFPLPPRMPAHSGQTKQGQTMQINPMQMIVDRFKQGMNPETILEQMGGAQAQQAKRIISGKSPAQLRGIAMNMAQQRGVNIEDVAAQLGLRLPE